MLKKYYKFSLVYLLIGSKINIIIMIIQILKLMYVQLDPAMAHLAPDIDG